MEAALKRSEINRLVMDYLVAEGFKEAAEKFKVEAGVEIARINSEAGAETSEQLDQRIEIRGAIEEGDISKALWLINQYYPELIDQNRQLFFKLHVSTATNELQDTNRFFAVNQCLFTLFKSNASNNN